MRHYQIIAFDAQGHRAEASSFEFEDDLRAIRRAIGEDFPHGCELWEGFRFVGRFHAPAPRPTAPAAALPRRKPALLH